MAETARTSEPQTDKISSEARVCGLVMPISAFDAYTSEHWTEVKAILTEAVCSVSEVNFTATLVSDGNEVGVIQKRIIQNLYNSDIVICDVSGKNPNVMFELGIRLAFDKPTVIVKDNETNYSFDTGVIEHLNYPRDLRFSKIVQFKKELASKLLATFKAGAGDPSYSPFLRSFGQYKVATLKEEEVPFDKAIMRALGDLQTQVAGIARPSANSELDAVNVVKRVVRAAKQYVASQPELSTQTPIISVGFSLI